MGAWLIDITLRCITAPKPFTKMNGELQRYDTTQLHDIIDNVPPPLLGNVSSIFGMRFVGADVSSEACEHAGLIALTSRPGFNQVMENISICDLFQV